MKTKDGVEFEIGMTLWEINDDEDGVFLMERNTGRGDCEIRGASVALIGYDNWRWFEIADCYASKAATAKVILPKLEEQLAWDREYISDLRAA